MEHRGEVARNVKCPCLQDMGVVDINLKAMHICICAQRKIYTRRTRVKDAISFYLATRKTK